MQRTRRSVTYQDIQECLSPCSTTDEETTEPCPEEYDTGDFKTPGPAVGLLARLYQKLGNKDGHRKAGTS